MPLFHSPSRSVAQINGHSRAACGPEMLEPRIAPAAVFTFTEADGDKVTIKTSRGTDADLALAVVLGPGNEYISLIDLSGALFVGTNLSIVSKAGGPAGDGFVNLGYLLAPNVDLGKLSIDGDLGKIAIGNTDGTTPAFKSLTVHSLGRFGVSTGAADLISTVTGDAGKIRVHTDIDGAALRVEKSLGDGGGLKQLSIGGSLIGGMAPDSGSIVIEGDCRTFKVGGSFVGGAGLSSGSIISMEGFGSVKIEGSLIGDGPGTGRLASQGPVGSLIVGGSIFSGGSNLSGAIDTTADVATVTVRGSIVGGPAGANFSGGIRIEGNVRAFVVEGDIIGGGGSVSGYVLLDTDGASKTVTIGGSVIGGAGSVSGVVSGGNVRALRIGGDIIGGDLTAGDLENSGSLYFQRLGIVTVSGSIIAGTDGGLGTLTKSGAIHAESSIGSLKVNGSVIGNETNRASITVEQSEFPLPAPAIGKLTIAGDVRFAQILAGVDIDFVPENGNASIGVVKIGGDVQAITIAAAVDPVDGRYGNADDIPFVDAFGITSRIAKIIIGGHVVPSPLPGVHGFVAEEIGAVIINGRKIALTPGAGNDVVPLGTFSDTTLREVM